MLKKRKYLVIYAIAFLVFLFSVLSLYKSYRELSNYIELANRANAVLNCFQNLSRQVNNAAILHPDLLKASTAHGLKVFIADSLAIVGQLNLLNQTVRDSINVKIANKLDVDVRPELSWLLKSNVADSIVNHHISQHVIAFQNINSLILKGIDRTNYMVSYRKLMLEKTLKTDAIRILVFIILASALGFFATTNLLRQRSKLRAGEKELLQKEQQYKNALDIMIEGIEIHDFDWKYLYVNDALAKFNDIPKEDFLGITLMEKYPGMAESDLFITLDHCMKQRVGKQMEIEFVFPNGRKADFELNIQPVPEGLFILSVEITERKKAEQSLLKVNRLFAFISAINQTIVHVKNKEELLDKASHIAVDVGKFKSSWIGLINASGTLDMVLVSGDADTVDRLRKYSGMDFTSDLLKETPTGRALRSGQFAVCNDVQNDPIMLPWKEEFVQSGVNANISFPIKQSGKIIGIFGFSSTTVNFFDKQEIELLQEAAGDISFALEIIENAKKHAETELLLVKNERRFRGLIEKSIDMKTLTNKYGNLIYYSPMVTEVLGYSEEDLLNTPAIAFFHPDDAPEITSNTLKVRDTPGDFITFRSRLIHKNGSYIWCEGTLTNMLHEPSINALVSNFRDISEKKIREEESEKMANDIIQRSKHLEQFAYIVSHNLRAPIANILGMANLLKDKIANEDREKIQRFLFSAVERLDEIVLDLNKILELRSATHENRELVDFESLVNDIRASISNYILQEKAEIVTHFEAIPHINAMRSYVHSIFYNLILNAVKYKKPDVPPLVSIKSELQDTTIKITFKDNGMGIDLERYGEKMFRLYSRFHPTTAEGRGVGLFMIKTQVETLGGSIHVKSRPGEGSEFIVELPVATV